MENLLNLCIKNKIKARHIKLLTNKSCECKMWIFNDSLKLSLCHGKSLDSYSKWKVYPESYFIKWPYISLKIKWHHDVLIFCNFTLVCCHPSCPLCTVQSSLRGVLLRAQPQGGHSALALSLASVLFSSPRLNIHIKTCALDGFFCMIFGRLISLNSVSV